MYFQISRYWTRRNVCFFTRPNLRTGKVDQLPDHLQYSHLMNILHGSRQLSSEDVELSAWTEIEHGQLVNNKLLLRRNWKL